MKIDLYKHIVSDLLKKGDRDRVKKDAYYHKKGGYVSYGITSVDFRAIMKKYRTDFKELNARQALTIIGKFYNSGVEDQIYAGNYIASLRYEVFNPSNLMIFDKALNNFHTWGTIDDFCVHVFEPLLRKYPKQIFILLKKWNSSENMWKRRASVVAFTRKAGECGLFTDQALELCDNLVNDKEDLVQKGVGWALKDVMRSDKEKVLEYIKKLRKQGASAVITLYALRDIKGPEKKHILKIKK